MSLVNAQAGLEMARCVNCDHDLVVLRSRGGADAGKVWCSNTNCRYHRVPYPNHKAPNAGRGAAA